MRLLVLAGGVGLGLSGCGADAAGSSPVGGDDAGTSEPDAPGNPNDPSDAPTSEQVTPLAQDSPGIDMMATDATHLYWAVNWLFSSAVRRMPLGGGPIETLYAGSGGHVTFAVEGDSVYIGQTRSFPDNFMGSILRVPVTGGSPTTIASVYKLGRIDVVDGLIYYREGVGESESRIMRVPTTGGQPHFIVSARRSTSPADLDVDTGFVFYVDQYSIMRAEAKTKKVLELTSSLPTEITVDDAHVYFVACAVSECPTASVYRVPRGGGTAEPLAPSVATGHYHQAKLAVIDDDLQWGARVLPKAGGPARVLHDTPSPSAVAATPQAFYFAEFYTGVIYRAAR